MASEEVIRAVGQKYSAAILTAADEPKSTQEISEELNIPIATCYRRIDELTEHNLLEVAGTRSASEGRRRDSFRRTIDSLRVDFEEPLTVTTERRDRDAMSKIDQLWSRTVNAAG